VFSRIWRRVLLLLLSKKEKSLFAALDDQYKWLLWEKSPKILVEALNCYGVYEFSGEENNPLIIEWAKEIGGWIGGWYTEDSIPWCGLFVGICAKRAGFPHSQKMLSARSWVEWGRESDKPSLGDVLVFSRSGGGHVGFYVGEDDEFYHVLGGNQSDAVNIMRIRKSRLISARRCEWRVRQPENVRVIKLSGRGNISENES